MNLIPSFRYLCLLPAVLTLAAAQTPQVRFRRILVDSDVRGVVLETDGDVIAAVNDKFDEEFGFLESRVYRLNRATGATVRSALIGTDRDQVGACTLSRDESLLFCNPLSFNSNFNNFTAVRTDDLAVAWKSSAVRGGDRGVPPVNVRAPGADNTQPREDLVVHHSKNSGIAVFSMDGRLRWGDIGKAAVGAIATSNDQGTIYYVDHESAQIGFPLVSASSRFGLSAQSSGPLPRTTAGCVPSSDGNSILHARQDGLYSSPASSVSSPPTLLTNSTLPGTNFGPFRRGSTLFIHDGSLTSAQQLQAFDLDSLQEIWLLDNVCATVPPAISADGQVLYTTVCDRGVSVSRIDWDDENSPSTTWTLPLGDGFSINQVSLVNDETELLLVASDFSTRRGYVYSILVDQLASPTISPQPTPSPTVSPASMTPSSEPTNSGAAGHVATSMSVLLVGTVVSLTTLI